MLIIFQQWLLISTILSIQLLFILLSLPSSSFNYDIFINSFNTNDIVNNHNRFYFSSSSSMISKTIFNQQKHTKCYMFQWKNTPFESIFNITNKNNNNKPLSSSVEETKEEKESSSSSDDDDTNYDNQLLKLRQESYGYTTRRKPLNDTTNKKKQSRIPNHDNNNNPKKKRNKQKDQEENNELLLETYENRIQLLQDIIQQYNETNITNSKKKQQEQHDQNDKLITTIKLLNNTIIKLQTKISNMQNTNKNDIQTYKRRIDILQDVVQKQYDNNVNNNQSMIIKNQQQLKEEQEEEIELLEIYYKHRIIQILQDIVQQYNITTTNNNHDHKLLQQNQESLNNTILELQTTISNIQKEKTNDIITYQRRMQILQDIIQQYNETSIKNTMQQQVLNNTILQLQCDISTIQNDKENDIEIYKRRINILQHAIKQYNESDVTTNANDTTAMTHLQSKIDNLQIDIEKDKYHMNILQNEIQEYNKSNCNYLMEQEILNNTILQLQSQMIQQKQQLLIKEKNDNNACNSNYIALLSNNKEKDKLLKKLDAYERRINILQDIISKYNQTNTNNIKLVSQLQYDSIKSKEVKLEQEKEINTYKRRVDILQDIISKYNQTSTNYIKQQKNKDNDYKRNDNKYKTKIIYLETKLNTLSQTLEDAKEQNMLLKQRQQYQEIEEEVQHQQHEQQQIQLLQTKLETTIEENYQKDAIIKQLQKKIYALLQKEENNQQATKYNINNQDDDNINNETLSKFYDIICAHERDIKYLSNMINEQEKHREKQRKKHGMFKRIFLRIFRKNRNKINNNLNSNNSNATTTTATKDAIDSNDKDGNY